MKTSNDSYVSVIIPVYNDSKNLIKCIEALRKQTFPKSRFEVIVVDNGSDEDMNLIIDKYPEVKFFSESKQSSYAARNMGIAQSNGNIVAFTDSDCIPSEDWIEMGVKALLKNDCIGVVGGKVELFFNDADNLSAVELYEKLYGFDQKVYIYKKNFSVTANIFTKISVVEGVGNFDDSLKSSGDKEWCIRVYEKGYKIIYAEEAVVSHPARKNIRDFSKKVRRQAGGYYRLNRKNGISTTSILIENLHDLVPPVIRIPQMFWSEKIKLLDRFSDKMKVITIFCLRRYLVVYENFMLLLGAEEKN